MSPKSPIYLGHELIERLSIEPFIPNIYLQSGLLQTIATQFWPRNILRKGHDMHFVQLDDGDKICLVEMKPSKEINAVLVLVHGLNGDYQSHYIQRMAMQSNQEGWLVYCVNLKNCGPSLGYSKTIYNAGNSSDVIQVLRWVKSRHSNIPRFLCGYSLGGNISLKAMGEVEPNLLQGGAVISTPVDLLASANKLAQPKNRLVNRNLFKHCLRQFEAMKFNLENPPYYVPSKSDLLKDFDENITAPMAGYSNAAEYYRKCSSIQTSSNVKIPVLILSSSDDPIVDHSYLSITQKNPNLEHLITNHGGHLGFIQHGTNGIHWLEDTLCVWFKSLLKNMNIRLNLA